MKGHIAVKLGFAANFWSTTTDLDPKPPLYLLQHGYPIRIALPHSLDMVGRSHAENPVDRSAPSSLGSVHILLTIRNLGGFQWHTMFSGGEQET